ncbi:hypothetical protein VTI74DRAFT_4924 [Chaetomium olivicolor]
MPNSPNTASAEATLDLSQIHKAQSRRARPPDPHAETRDAVRVPLKEEAGDKARWRESRLGLKNIFSRNKGETETDRGSLSPGNMTQGSGRIRASLAQINWPYGLNHAQGHRSETTLPSFSKRSTAAPSLKHKKSESGVRPQPTPEGIAAWNPPPLFQAYPQAIKHAHLPACTVSAEVVLRLHNHKNNGSLSSILSSNAPDIPEEATGEKPKRRHRRNGSGSTSRFDWTTKVFVLVTSGYLLQYAGEGSFDRLPERVLQLGKDSAAFASDAIPGRHWVLQVESVADPDRTPGSHAALRARLPFRTHERKSSTFLMVFENAAEMDSWIATLRREIETLGGRKVLSEIGKPKTSGQDPQLRNQASQRTLVVRDPDRFSRVVTSDQPCRRSSVISTDSRLDPNHEDPNRDQSFDDNSTASVISHEGRQLDSLRDSTNRLSYMSSGQRTMLTSVGSSPACSPIRDSFGELDSLPPEVPHLDEEPQPRLRPNAMAIIDRRQSLQAVNHVLEMRVASAQALRTSSTQSNSGQPELTMPFAPQLPVPNFSVPHSASKRHSFVRNSMGMPPTHITTSPLLGRMSARRPPPSALAINPRPLSLVEDQPSPALSALSRVASGTDTTGSPLSITPTTPPTSSSPQPAESKVMVRETKGGPARDLDAPEKEDTPEAVSQRDQRPLSEASDRDLERLNAISLSSGPLPSPRELPRSVSSLGTYGRSRPAPPTAARPRLRCRGQSFTSPTPNDTPAAFRYPPLATRPELPRAQTPSLRPVSRSSQHLRPDSQSHTLSQKPATSQLADGPPPAPPPNRALPPIPQRARVSSIPPPGFF